MKYPNKLVTLADGSRLFVPDEEQVRSVYESLLVKDPNTPFPFWAKIWPSAIALSDFLKTEPDWITGKRVLEIGAGIGLPSFTMATHAAEMIISDHSADAVLLINKNIQYLGLSNVTAKCLDWNHFPVDCKADLVLLSDINYAPDQFESLQRLIRNFMVQGTTLILSTPHRIMVTPFAEAVNPYIKRTALKKVTHLNQEIEISIWILSK